MPTRATGLPVDPDRHTGAGAGRLPGMGDAVGEFEARRGRMFGLAYRMLGSAQDAEDVVQDAFLRWDAVPHDSVQNPTAWLDKVVTNLCLSRLTSARARRERYVGPWLPEPVHLGGVLGTDELGPDQLAEHADSASFATLVLLERLAPTERAVFVLRTAFGHSHREIADRLDISEAASRQLFSRASAHLDEPKARFTPDRDQHRRLLDGFLRAARYGDVDGLERLLAADVVSYADGGGITRAARRPVIGPNRVARYISLGLSRYADEMVIDVVELNGAPAVVARSAFGTTAGTIAGVLLLDVRDGRIAALHIVANPEKLAFLGRQLAGTLAEVSHPGWPSGLT